jgi:hypothetical protein
MDVPAVDGLFRLEPPRASTAQETAANRQRVADALAEALLEEVHRRGALSPAQAAKAMRRARPGARTPAAGRSRRVGAKRPSGKSGTRRRKSRGGKRRRRVSS